MGTESRKLAAILFADMVGFSALRQAVALELRDAMMALAAEMFPPHRGRLVNTMGDGFMAEFPTAIDAVQFATGLQEAIAARNGKGEHEGVTRLRVRMGVHVGEVIIQGDGLYGANVNIAARCEKLAAPGGICMTDQVWEQVRDDLGKRARNLGRMRARNIRQRFTFYHLDPPGAGLGFRLAHRVRSSTVAAGMFRLVTAGAVVLMLGLFAARAYWNWRQPRTSQEWLQRGEQLLVNYDYPGHLTNALDALHEAARLDGGNTRAVANLGWAYWLLYEETEREEARGEASRWSSNALTLNTENPRAQLVRGLVARNMLNWPAATNHLLKANDLTRSADGLVLVSLAGAFRSVGNTGIAAQFAQMAEQNAGNRWDVFQRLAKYYFRSESQTAELRHARACCEQALRYSPTSPLVRILLGQILLMQNQPVRAKEEFDRAMKLRRTANELSAIGSAYLKVGNCAQALDYFLQANRADPSKYLYHVNTGIAQYQCSNPDGAKEQFGMALAQIEETLRSGGENGLTRAYSGLCRAALGQSDQARSDLERALEEERLDLQVLRVVRRAYKILGDGEKVGGIEQLLRQRGD